MTKFVDGESMALLRVPENWREILINKAEIACIHFNISQATLGNKIIDNAAIFDDLRKGKGCHVDTLIEIINWFKRNIPHKAAPLHNSYGKVKKKVKKR